MAAELGTNFIAKLEPFLLMAKSAKGAGAAKLIQDATSAPGVFVFSELLELPNIQELAQHETHASFYHLLQLFAYRTFEDYLAHKNALPPLNDAQTIKLKHLSLVSSASERRILSYSYLMKVLQMPTIRELEDLVIDAIYLDLLRGKLDQKEQQLEVEYTTGRDIEPDKIESLLVALKSWASTTSSVLDTLDHKMAALASEAKVKKTQQEEQEKLVQAAIRDASEKTKEGRTARKALGLANIFSGNDRDRDDRMDVDEPAFEGLRGKLRKPPQESINKQTRKRKL